MPANVPFAQDTTLRNFPPRDPNFSNPPAETGPDLRPVRRYRKKTLTIIQFSLASAFVQTPVEVPGTVFWVSGTDNTAYMRIQIDPQAGATAANANTLGQLVQNGFRLGGIPFQKLLVTNPTAQAGLTLELTIGTDYPDERLDINL